MTTCTITPTVVPSLANRVIDAVFRYFSRSVVAR
jgi:hypothetical protein